MARQQGSGLHAYADEVEAVIDFEEDELRKGHLENVILLEALAGNISVDQFLKNARFRGRHWGFLSALSDKSLQIQGYAMLHFMADALGKDLAVQIYYKTRRIFAQLGRIKGEMDARYGQHEWSEQLYAETMDDLVDMTRDTRRRYWNRVGRLLE